MGKFDPYASGPAPKRPGVVRSIAYDATTGEHILEMPRPGPTAAVRIVFMEISGGVGTRTVQIAARATTVRYEFPPNGRVAVFVVEETEQGERSPAGPVNYFRAVRKAPPRPGSPAVVKLEEVG